jgi:crotonobetainyl-CoA hydratase
VGGFGGLQELRGLSKPVIAAVNGICCGGGLEWALSADIILAADHAQFALPEIRSGTVADAASVKLPKRIPYHIAMEMLLTGRWIEAEEAHRWGMVNHLYPSDILMEKAREMGDLLASGPPLVYAAIKEIVREAEALTFHALLPKNAIRSGKGVNFRTSRTLTIAGSYETRARVWAKRTNRTFCTLVLYRNRSAAQGRCTRCT